MVLSWRRHDRPPLPPVQPIPRGTAPYWGVRRKSLRAQPASPPTGPTAQTAGAHPASRSACRDHRRGNRGPGCAVCLVARGGQADLAARRTRLPCPPFTSSPRSRLINISSGCSPFLRYEGEGTALLGFQTRRRVRSTEILPHFCLTL